MEDWWVVDTDWLREKELIDRILLKSSQISSQS